jgi:muramoyltetrapeptide carboxypeptidase LdcA involved in peptidoglycan recycling
LLKTDLGELDLEVSFSKNAEEKDEFFSSTVKSRLKDLHDAFADKSIKAIFTTIGGFNSNQLLKYLDYNLIRRNPKILCGYSDITALNNAIYKKTNLVTYSGPHFSTLGMTKGLDYTLEYLKKCLFNKNQFEIKPSKNWSDDPWYENQQKRKFIKNTGFLIVNEGDAEGITIGRFQKASRITPEKIIKIIKTKNELKNIPVIAGVDFGHTTPQITFPIGGRARLLVKKKNVKLEILKH